MKTELTPTTIRLNDSSISALKEEARRISFEGNTDVLSVDYMLTCITTKEA